MKAIQITATDGSEVLEYRAVPDQLSKLLLSVRG